VAARASTRPSFSLGGYVPCAPGDGEDFLVCFRSYFVMGFKCTKIEHSFIEKMMEFITRLRGPNIGRI
jgi:hypothetical protein